jgi:hypothetical protein
MMDDGAQLDTTVTLFKDFETTGFIGKVCIVRLQTS